MSGPLAIPRDLGAMPAHCVRCAQPLAPPYVWRCRACEAWFCRECANAHLARQCCEACS